MPKPLKLLMVEDSPNDAVLVLRQLHHDGYEVTCERVETKADFKAKLDPGIDLVLSDYQLPQFNGIEALTILKQSGLDIPFILVSGTIGEDLAVQAMQAGAADYLMKDRLTRLGPAVEHSLNQARLRVEQRKAVDALKLFRSLVDHSNDALEVLDPSTGRYLDANEKAYTALDYTREELLSMTVFDVDPVMDVGMWAQILAKLGTSGGARGESRHRRKDGSSFPVEFSAKIVSLDRVYLVAVVRDISERKDLEARFFRAQRMEAIGSLASGIAHDMNNILAPILMSAPLLRLGLTEEETTQMLDSIEASAQRGSELVKQLLTFGRGVEGARHVLRPDLLVHEMVGIAQQTFPKNIRIVEEMPKTLWPIIGDSTQLHQVLLNLSVNARDAMPHGGLLTISAEEVVFDAAMVAATPGAKVGPYVMIRVSDTGTGIAPEILNKIFDPFFTTKDAGQGTGLGLSTVIGIVKSHEGMISVKSEPGVGTSFEIHLPASPKSTGAPEPSKGTVAPPRGHGELLLVVDDEEPIRTIIRDLLIKYGYRVVTATNGEEAAGIYSQRGTEIAAVITDLDMPIMNGIALIQALRRMNPSVLAIVSSGIASMRGMERKSAELEKLGVSVILKKPYAVEEILGAVDALFSAGNRPTPKK